MPEIVNDKTIFTLFEVTRSIQKTIAERYKSSYWIKAEMNKLNYFPRSGHCYPDLVEKQNGKVIAEMKCNLWKDDYVHINSTFQRVLKEPLKDGIKILFLATISFHPEHGLSLRILDIDPAFTLGDLEREKQDTINKLQAGGIFGKNKTFKLPLLTQRIAIISVSTSKGYQDFLGKIENNPWGYKFFHMLFPSILQGDKVIEQMTIQLERINKVKTHFDAVAIIRGGGGDVGLSCFNNYEFAKTVALFPLPVLSGIGHITNDTVVEMVSHKSFITPTDLANFLFQEFHNFSFPVQKAEEKIIDRSRRLLTDEKNRLRSAIKLCSSVTENVLIKSSNGIKEQVHSLCRQSIFLFRNEKANLVSISEGIRKGTNAFCNTAKQETRQLARMMKKDVISRLNRLKFVINLNAQEMVKYSHILLKTRKKNIIQLTEKFSDKSWLLLKNETAALNGIEKNVNNMSPENVMKRGYSITLYNGKAIKTSDEIKTGDIVNTLLFKGRLSSQVKSTDKKEEL